LLLSGVPCMRSEPGGPNARTYVYIPPSMVITWPVM
jgi:hypothetical protein